MRRPTSTFDAAREYIDRGWPVFLLAPRPKLPLVPKSAGGQGLYDATRDFEVIRDQLVQNPDSNLAVRTGIICDVVDLDGLVATEALEKARMGREKLRGPMVRTRKGWHIHVAHTGLGNRAGVLSGMDFRGQEGYAVVPPSVHPDGHRYEWLTPTTQSDHYLTGFESCSGQNGE